MEPHEGDYKALRKIIRSHVAFDIMNASPEIDVVNSLTRTYGEALLDCGDFILEDLSGSTQGMATDVIAWMWTKEDDRAEQEKTSTKPISISKTEPAPGRFPTLPPSCQNDPMKMNNLLTLAISNDLKILDLKMQNGANKADPTIKMRVHKLRELQNQLASLLPASPRIERK